MIMSPPAQEHTVPRRILYCRQRQRQRQRQLRFGQQQGRTTTTSTRSASAAVLARKRRLWFPSFSHRIGFLVAVAWLFRDESPMGLKTKIGFLGAVSVGVAAAAASPTTTATAATKSENLSQVAVSSQNFQSTATSTMPLQYPQQQHQHQPHPPHRINMNSAIETRIFAESAVIDKETGRIFWEGGVGSTTAAVSEKLDTLLGGFVRLQHVKAVLLTAILFLCVTGYVVEMFQQGHLKLPLFLVNNWAALNQHHAWIATAISSVFQIFFWVAIPKHPPPAWFFVTILVLYWTEAYYSRTRHYLSNAISSPVGVENYIESLRKQDPVVEWKVRSYHYEPRATTLWGETHRKTTVESEIQEDEQLAPSSSSTVAKTALSKKSIPIVATTGGHGDGNAALPWWNQRKVITKQAIGTFPYVQVTDKTMVGVWKRSPAGARSYSKNKKSNTNGNELSFPPFTKIILTKLLVLSDRKAVHHYLKEQQAFVQSHAGSDQFTEFSTRIDVPGFQSHMLAVRPLTSASPSSSSSSWSLTRTKLFRLTMFWFLTAIGLTVPYRLWFDQHCDELRVIVVKEVSATVHAASSATSADYQSTTNSFFSMRNWWWYGNAPPTTTSTTNNTSIADTDIGMEEEEDGQFRAVMQQLQLYGIKRKRADKLNLEPAPVVVVNQVQEQKNQSSPDQETSAQHDATDVVVTKPLNSTPVPTLGRFNESGIPTVNLFNASEVPAAMTVNSSSVVATRTEGDGTIENNATNEMKNTKGTSEYILSNSTNKLKVDPASKTENKTNSTNNSANAPK